MCGHDLAITPQVFSNSFEIKFDPKINSLALLEAKTCNDCSDVFYCNDGVANACLCGYDGSSGEGIYGGNDGVFLIKRLA